MPHHVYRVLIDARPLASAVGLSPPGAQGLVSVAVRAPNAQAAEAEAMSLLPMCGWTPLGSTVRTSDLTELLKGSHHHAFDSAYGELAQQWLQIVHDEALEEGSSLHLVSVDYEYLDRPRRLKPLFGP